MRIIDASDLRSDPILDLVSVRILDAVHCGID